MTEVVGRRERQRQSTLDEIVTASREILRAGGELSLRAVAQRMGMTAPALYRYVDSYQDLLMLVAVGIDTAMTEEQLVPARDRYPEDDPAAQVAAAAVAFRTWALTSRAEFGVVFANMDVASMCVDPTLVETTLTNTAPSGELFNHLLVRIWEKYQTPYPPLEELGDELVEVLRNPIMPGEIDIPDEMRGLLWVYMRSWAALYGTVTLEVFGHIDPRVIESGAMFRQMFVDQAHVLGLAHELPRIMALVDEELSTR